MIVLGLTDATHTNNVNDPAFKRVAHINIFEALFLLQQVSTMSIVSDSIKNQKKLNFSSQISHYVRSFVTMNIFK